MKITVALDADAPEQYLDALNAIPGVGAVRAKDPSAAWVKVNSATQPLHVLALDPASDGRTPGQVAKQLASQVPPGAVGFVVAGTVPRDERKALESAHLSYLDTRGLLHLEFGDVLVHIDRTPPRVVADVPRARGVGPAGIRAAQVVLGSIQSDWSELRLASAAAVSLGTAHHILALMEEHEFARTEGVGRHRKRIITRRAAALDWIADVERRRPSPVADATYLAARDGEDLLHQFHERAQSAGIRYAVTAGLGAKLLGIPMLTRVSAAQIRIDSSDSPAALEQLGLAPVPLEELRGGREPNLELWADVGRLGTFGATTVDGVTVAPAVRVWLDLARQSSRAEDAAKLFAELDRG